MAKFLLKVGADPNLTDERGVSPLMATIQENDQAVIDLLFTSGAKTDVYAASGRCDQATVVAMLAEDSTCHLSEHVRPVILAVLSGNAKILKLELETGANPNETRDSWMRVRTPTLQ